MSQSITKKKVIAVDLETTMRCVRDGFSSATPWYDRNRVLAAGAYDGNIFVHDPNVLELMVYVNGHSSADTIIVGHNFKFDLAYIHKALDNQKEFNQFLAYPMWDTSIAHYMLTEQREHMPSLATCQGVWAPHAPAKDDLIKRLVDEGKTTEDVEYDVLVDYLQKDCITTYEVAIAQMKEAQRRDMTRAIFTRCAAMKAEAKIEIRGIGLNMAEMGLVAHDIAEEKSILISGMTSVIIKLYETNGLSKENLRCLQDAIPDLLNSHQFWSHFFFNTPYTMKCKVPNGLWKSGAKKGQIRYRTEEIPLPVHMTDGYSPVEMGATRTKQGHFSVEASVLEKLARTSACAGILLRYRELEKLESTYVEGLPKKSWYESSPDVSVHTIHPNINQTVTNTGRQSQSNPNLQNQPGDERIKRVFVPHTFYRFIEADYKQLEVVAFAYTYRDPQLIEDLIRGVDIHGVLATDIYGPGYTKDQRRIIKGVVFGTIYGGGAETIAKQSGLQQGQVWEIQRHFFKRYSTIKPMRKHVEDQLRKEFQTYIHSRRSDRQEPYAVLDSVTGRCYAIPMNKKLVPRGIEWNPAYTKMCNYPIQGLATADIVPMMLAYMEKKIRTEGWDLHMVNTVHDSILFEAPAASVADYATKVKEELSKAPQIFESIFRHEFDLPLNVEVQYIPQSVIAPSWNGPWVKLPD